MDLLESITANKWGFLIIVVLGLSLGIIRLMQMPHIYEASAVAVLLTREKAVVDAAVDTSSVEASDHTAGRGTAGNLMLPPDPNLYSTIIMSRAVLTEIAEQHEAELAGDISERDRSEEVISQLRSMIKVTTTEEGIITISVTSLKPELSASIANSMFAECKRVSRSIERELLLTQAEHLDKTYLMALRRLTDSEQKIGELSENHDLVDPQLQAMNQLKTLRELNNRRDELERDLEELLVSYTEGSEAVKNLRVRLEGVLRHIENCKQNIIGEVGTRTFGRFNIEYTRLKQQTRFQRDILDTIATKADIYRIRAEQPIGNIAIIREASTPTRPKGPSKKIELGMSAVITLILAAAYAIFRQQINYLTMNPELAARTNKILQQVHPRLKLKAIK